MEEEAAFLSSQFAVGDEKIPFAPAKRLDAADGFRSAGVPVDEFHAQPVLDRFVDETRELFRDRRWRKGQGGPGRAKWAVTSGSASELLQPYAEFAGLAIVVDVPRAAPFFLGHGFRRRHIGVGLPRGVEAGFHCDAGSLRRGLVASAVLCGSG